MSITYDPLKNAKNIKERNLSFELVADFDWNTALIWQDTRKDYTEKRYSALGFIKQRLHVVIFTETKTGIRVISLRKANKREVNRYEQNF